MLKRLVYIFWKQVAKLNVILYFSKIEINGEENVPADDAPFIYAVNHQAAFLDAVLLGTLSPFPVHYLTRSDVFKPATQWILSAFNMIPIYRIRDGFASLSKNEAIFETIKELLLQDKRILIFPEGNHHHTHFLRPITKGVSRIAFNSQLVNKKDIWIVPVGLNYFSHTRSGRKLILNYGKPIRVKDFMPESADPGPKDLNKFRLAVADAMKDMLVIPEDDGNYNNRKLVFNRKNEKLNFKEIRHLANGNQHFIEQPPSAFANILSKILLLPNLPAFILYYWVEKNKIGQTAFISSIKLAFGMFVFPLWLLLSFIVAGLIWGWSIGGIVVAIQLLAFFIRRYVVRFA